MKLPLIIVSYLPKKLQDKYIQHVWDNKKDRSILRAFVDATDWIDLSIGSMDSLVVADIAEDCVKRLDKHIMPQMRKRKLTKEIPNV